MEEGNVGKESALPEETEVIGEGTHNDLRLTIYD
jgi:hypothetical protein